MALSGKTAAPFEIPYYLGEDKPPSLAEGTKKPGERVHALFEALGAKDVLSGTASAGELLIAQPGDVARFKAMKGDGTIDGEGNFQLGDLGLGTVWCAPTFGATEAKTMAIKTTWHVQVQVVQPCLLTGVSFVTGGVPTGETHKVIAGLFNSARELLASSGEVTASTEELHMVKAPFSKPESVAPGRYTLSLIGNGNVTATFSRTLRPCGKSLGGGFALTSPPVEMENELGMIPLMATY